MSDNIVRVSYDLNGQTFWFDLYREAIRACETRGEFDDLVWVSLLDDIQEKSGIVLRDGAALDVWEGHDEGP